MQNLDRRRRLRGTGLLIVDVLEASDPIALNTQEVIAWCQDLQPERPAKLIQRTLYTLAEREYVQMELELFTPNGEREQERTLWRIHEQLTLFEDDWVTLSDLFNALHRGTA